LLLVSACLFFPLQLQSQPLNIANKFIGLKESGNNRGFWIDKFNYTVGNKYGSAWCMAFVYYCINETYKPNPLKRTGSVSNQLKYANCIGSGLQVIKTSLIGNTKLLPNDIFCIKHGNTSENDIGKLWLGHTGFIKLDLGKTVQTVEGNTNKAGSREGQFVLDKYRDKIQFLAVIRIKI